MPLARSLWRYWPRYRRSWTRFTSTFCQDKQDYRYSPLPLIDLPSASEMPQPEARPVYRYKDLDTQPRSRILTSRRSAKGAMKLLKGNVIGLDVEYIEEISETHHPRKRPALLQLCDEHSVLLIQLKNGLESRLLGRTLQLLCDPKITKVGVGIHNDCANLVRAYGDQFFQNDRVIKQPVSILELQHLAHEIDCPIKLKPGYYSLAGFCERYLGKKLCKNGNSHRGAWCDQLSEKEQNYAANDVTCSFQIFHELKKKADISGKQLDIGKLCRPIDIAAICRKGNHT